MVVEVLSVPPSRALHLANGGKRTGGAVERTVVLFTITVLLLHLLDLGRVPLRFGSVCAPFGAKAWRF